MKREAKTEFIQHPKSPNSPLSGKLNNVVDFGACYACRITTVIGDMPLIKDGGGIDFTPPYPWVTFASSRPFGFINHSSTAANGLASASINHLRCGEGTATPVRERTLIKQVPLIVTQASMISPSSATPAAVNGYYTCDVAPRAEIKRQHMNCGNKKVSYIALPDQQSTPPFRFSTMKSSTLS